MRVVCLALAVSLLGSANGQITKQGRQHREGGVLPSPTQQLAMQLMSFSPPSAAFQSPVMGVNRVAASRFERPKTRAAAATMLFDQIFGGGKVKASHILVKDNFAANTIKKRIEGGEIGFEEAARQFSTCPSAAKGGDLGLFGPGQMVKPFDRYCFDADTVVGELAVVDTQFGSHVIKLTKKA